MRLLVLLLLLLATPAAGQPRAVTLVVPYTAGGGTDIVAREFAIGFGRELGANVVVENRGGAAGQIGAVAVLRARPDGTTLLYAVNSNVTVNPHIQPGPPVDLAGGLLAIAQTGTYHYVVVVHPAVPARTLGELLALGRAPGSDLSFSSSGVGGNNHLAGVLLAEAAGFRMEHIPYRGTAPALLDVVAGRITMNISSPPPAVPLVRDGRLRALAVTGARRMGSLPDVPTLAEAGLPGLVIEGWHGLFAPPGTPEATLLALERAARAALAADGFRRRLEQDGLEAAPERTRAELQDAVLAENAFWRVKARELNLRPE